MNKIEAAIHDVKVHIEAKERQLLICQTELKSLNEYLKTLEIIQNSKSIPHETYKPELNNL